MIARDLKPTLFGQLDSQIAWLLSDSAQLDTLYAAAYRHPNGFAKLPLFNEPDGSMVRIHHWHKGPVADANVHSHRWDMRSVILDGAYRARDYEEAADGEPSGKYRCAENRDGHYEIEFIGDVRLRIAQERSYRTGDCYEMAAGLIHSVDTIESEEVLSLVQCSASCFDHSSVYARRGMRPANVAPTRLSRVELVQILHKTREALSLLDRL